ALAIITTSFHQPISNFVAYKPNPHENEVSFSIWSRADGARYNIGSTSSLNVVGGGALNDVLSAQRLAYQGFQVGADVALLNINGSHWNAHGGVTSGQITGDISQRQGSIGNTSFNMPFVGLYGFLTNGPFAADLTVRHDFNRLEMTNSLAGLDE